MKKILVVVDIQNDFVDGALGTCEAVAIIDNAAQKIKNFDGDIKVSNLQISKPDTAINIGNLSLSSRNKGKGRLVSANGNFGEAEINGKFNFEYLARDFLDIINPMDNHGKRHSDENVFDFNVHLKDATIINLLANTNMPLS